MNESVRNLHDDIEEMQDVKHKKNAKSITERNRSENVDKPKDPALQEKDDYLKKLS